MSDKELIEQLAKEHGLLPCPFCGDEHFSSMDMTSFHPEGETKWKRIKCVTCGCQAPDTVWNTRAKAYAQTQGLSIDKTCDWKGEDNDTMPSTYSGTCGIMWSFIEDGLAENDCKFCPRCGGKINDITVYPESDE